MSVSMDWDNITDVIRLRSGSLRVGRPGLVCALMATAHLVNILFFVKAY